jgi:hypothetical protein
MNAQDWFGLGVRFAGIWCGIQAVVYVVTFLDVRLGFSELRGAGVGFGGNSPVGYLLYAAGYLGLALCFLLQADLLTQLTFRRRAPEQQQHLEPDENSKQQLTEGDSHASP